MRVSKQAELFTAIHNKDADAVGCLLDAGAAPNVSLSPDEYIDWLDSLSNGKAGLRGNVEFRQMLTKAYEPESLRGNYPLFEAFNCPAILEKLLRHGARADVRNLLTDNTPLHELACNFHMYDHAYDSAMLLLEAGAPLETWNNDGRTPLQIGCWRKTDGSILAAMLARGASVQARDRDGDTALHLAGFWDEGYLPWPGDDCQDTGPDDEDEPAEFVPFSQPWRARDAVNALVDAGADPNSVNPNTGYTPMHWASVHHGYPYLAFLETLSERGGKMYIPNHEGMLPLDMYVEGAEDTARLERFTAELGKQENATAPFANQADKQFRLWLAVVGNHPEGVEAALAAGADPNIPIATGELLAHVRSSLGMKDYEDEGGSDNGSGNQPGTSRRVFENYAVFRSLGHPAILERLLEAGAKTDVANYPTGYAPLHELASNQFIKPAKAAAALLRAGADVDILDKKGRTPLQIACEFKADGALIALLLRHGASTSHRDSDGRTALMHAKSNAGYRKWLADHYSKNDGSAFARRQLSAHEQPWSLKDATRALSEAEGNRDGRLE